MTAPHTPPVAADSSGWLDAIHALPVAVATVSADGVLADTNRTFDGLCGDIHPGTALVDLIAPEERGRVGDLGALPDDVLVRLASGRSAWITARAVPGAGYVICLRAVELDAAAVPTAGEPRLHVGVLGRCQVDGARSGAWLEQRPGQLLRLLVSARDRVLTTDELIDALWPGGEARSASTVRYLVHTLRAHLEPDRGARAAGSVVVSHRGGYRLDPERVVVDADLFEREARDGLAAHAAGGDALARRLLERAAGRYGGDFLPEEPYADWAAPERERLRELAGRVLRALATLDETAGNLDAASEHLARLAALEPLDIEIQRDLIALCLRRGRRGEATRRYQALRRRAATAENVSLPFTLDALSA